MKKYIFTDVDGVLNNAHAKGIRDGFAWIDDENIHIYSEFVRWCYTEFGRENVVLVLTSSWRSNNFHGKSFMRKVLDERLADKESIFFDDETERIDLWSRGLEIASYIIMHEQEIDGYITLDDIMWEDFKPLHLTSHWIQTSDNPRNGLGGLRNKHLKRMKEIISKPIKAADFELLRQYLHFFKASQ